MISRTWTKSSRSGGAGECVEVRLSGEADEAIQVRDSKDPEGGFLEVSRGAFSAFVRDVKAGRFDL